MVVIPRRVVGESFALLIWSLKRVDPSTTLRMTKEVSLGCHFDPSGGISFFNCAL